MIKCSHPWSSNDFVFKDVWWRQRELPRVEVQMLKNWRCRMSDVSLRLVVVDSVQACGSIEHWNEQRTIFLWNWFHICFWNSFKTIKMIRMFLISCLISIHRFLCFLMFVINLQMSILNEIVPIGLFINCYDQYCLNG